MARRCLASVAISLLLMLGGCMSLQPASTSLAAGGAEIPISLVRGIPLIELTTPSGQTQRWLLDTGSGGVAITRDALKAWPHVAPRRADGYNVFDAAGHRAPLVLAHINRMRVGPAEFSNFDAVVVDLQNVSANAGSGGQIDGLLGWPLFRELLVTIDYPHRTLILEHGQLPPPNGQDVLPLKVAGNLPYVPISIGSMQMWAGLDTGNGTPTAVQLMASDLRGAKWRSPPVQGGLTSQLLTRTRSEMGRLDGEMRLGRYVVVQPTVAVGEEGTVNLLSAALLRKFRVTCDFHNQRVRFTRTSSEPIESPPVRTLGFNYDETSQEPLVTDVTPGSAAQHVGIRLGDVVIAINGRSPLGVDWAEIDRAGGPVSVEVLRNGKRVRVEVPITVLVP